MNLDPTDRFAPRHIGPRAEEIDLMLRTVGASTLDALIDQTIPAAIRQPHPLNLPPAESESSYLNRLGQIAHRNRVCRSFIGLGYADTITPSVIRRCLFEDPSWYTPYTPYQAEIAQGRLESLLNFQTMVSDLTGMEVANASLLDEATAAAEAMMLLQRIQSRRLGSEGGMFLVSDRCFPQTLDVLHSRAAPLGIELAVRPLERMTFEAGVFGVLLQYPDEGGRVDDLRPFTARAHEMGVQVAVATDLLALALFTPPGEMGADVVFGNSQRFGVPLGFGGPHAAFFAVRQSSVRHLPGRLIGVSVDADGHQAFRMALQTREQHIRREKATSNICTAQALLANMAAMYAVYHGPDGIRAIAARVHGLARLLDRALCAVGYKQQNLAFFDTLRVGLEPAQLEAVRRAALEVGMNFRYVDDRTIGVALDETTTLEEVRIIAEIFAAVAGRPLKPELGDPTSLTEQIAAPPGLARSTPYLTHPVFNTHRSETEMMRYLKTLGRRDVGLDTSMIALGSCTMKLNAATEMIPVSWPEFSRMHPFAPSDQTEGYRELFRELEQALCEVTGLPAVSLQPNSGAQGEFAGLAAIRAFHRKAGEPDRDVVLIPASAHGTNPASASMAGFRVVVIATDSNGNVDLADLRARAEEHRDRLAALMITYPSTHGVFEEAIREICGIVHEHGGQVYMDGANMNAQVGLTSPALIGADVCHLNLHKTFAIPHGGGGPGMGPIAAAAHLAPFLPGHRLAPVGGEDAIPAVSAAPWGSASILLISHAYVRMLGGPGMTEATRLAILNANYIKARLQGHFDVLYARSNGRVAHEMIFDLRSFKPKGIDESDVAKRLMDYGFHAPTVSFPVPGTLMVEPTESESKAELDRFCEALIAIRGEIAEVVSGAAHPKDNVLKNAPHTAAAVSADTWSHPYSREKAAFPLPWVKGAKFWPPVARIDNPYGDRNLMCVCPPVEAYA